VAPVVREPVGVKTWLRGLFNQDGKHPSRIDIINVFAEAVGSHQAGRLEDAEAGYRQVLEAQPDHFDALHLSGVVKLQRGEHEAAVEWITKALGVNPGQAAPYSNLGLALQKVGRAEEALAALNRAIELQPHYAEALSNRADIYKQLGRFDKALENYGALLKLRPDDSEALNNLGITLCSLNRQEDALFSFDRAIALAPDDAKLHNNRGAALGGLLRFEEALASHQMAIELAPRYADALYNRAAMLSAMKRHEAAVASYQQALASRPHYPEALNGLGTSLRELGRTQESLDRYDRAIAIQPVFAEALDNRGIVLAALGRHEEALSSHDRALAIRSSFPQALINRATTLRETGQLSAAAVAYRRALEVDPDSLALRIKMTIASIPVLAMAEEEIAVSRANLQEEIRRLFQWSQSNGIGQEDQAVGVMQPFHLAYQEENNRDVLAEYGRVCSMLMSRWQLRKGITAKGRRTPASGRIKVGVASAHVHAHSVWHAIIKGWLHCIDPQKFEIHVFHLGTFCDGQTDWARSHCERFESGSRGVEDWARSIAGDGLDILIYPEIGMDVITVKLASMRLAPLQIASWGHPETTGLPTIDYFLSSELFENSGSQDCYSEKLIALPNLGCHYLPENVAVEEISRETFGIPNGSALFICPGTPFKYSPSHDRVFVDIALRMPQARFIFFKFGPVPSLSDRLFARIAGVFESAGLDASDHIVLVPWQSKAGFFGLMKNADVFLDTIGFSGFNTAMQAIECGLPVVTREGKFMRGRFASAILKRLNLDELVACSDERYVDTAVRLAQDASFSLRVREQIHTRKALLFGDPAPVAALESLLLRLASECGKGGAQPD
jgi:protein O-GlcNAc transferase